MTRMTPTTTLLAAALLAATATLAIASPQSATGTAARPAAARVKLDANGDGAIDRAEAAKSPRLAGKFEQMDRNRDGRISAEERPHGKGGHGPGHGGRRGGMERMDGDGDGRISRAEFDAGAAARQQRMAGKGMPGGEGKAMAGARPQFDFAAADANRDGYLVRGELRAYHERLRPQREAAFAKRSAEQFAAADLNRDGKLSRVEVSEKMPRMTESFAWMDENRDGFLSREEMKPHRGR